VEATESKTQCWNSRFSAFSSQKSFLLLEILLGYLETIEEVISLGLETGRMRQVLIAPASLFCLLVTQSFIIHA
jgi:hypothetical protein